MSFNRHSITESVVIPVFALAVILAVPSAGLAVDINVPGDQPTIQAGINAAANGDVVIVAEGVYPEAINFFGKAITVRSTDPTDPDVVANTIIDGTGFFHVVQCVSGEGPDTVLNGFVITGGNATSMGQTRGGGMYNVGTSPTVTNCTFTANTASNAGGGMYNEQSSPTVTNCTFSNCITFQHGAGMMNEDSSPIVTNCTFIGNTAGNAGGGMANDLSTTTVTNCTFSNNSCNNLGGGMFNFGGHPIVTNCSFIQNSANLGNGGGGMCNNFSDPEVINCLFDSNSAEHTGGGMRNDHSNATIVNCTFTGNISTGTGTFEGGGGMFNTTSNPTVTNCLFSGNVANAGGGMANLPDSNVTVANCIVWGNAPTQISDVGTTTVSFSDIQGGRSGTGNIDADPLFVDPDNGDYRLQPGSPCIDAADNAAVPVGITSDLAGNPRFVDDPDTPDCPQSPGQCGDPPVVDMGAYEFQAQPPCPWDCDSGESIDGTVGIVDFLTLLGQWGGPGSCDFDGGGVGITDFLELLANWGPCP